MCEVLLCLLRKEFDVIGISKDGRDLVETALSLRPDLIVSDIMMPLLTGPQAMEQLSARGYDIPFVFISSYDGLIVSGRSSFVSKTDVYWELVPAVHATASGKIYNSRRRRSRYPP
jgi:CheY-like chemotaxis protein